MVIHPTPPMLRLREILGFSDRRPRTQSPQEIIPGIFLGSYEDAENIPLLRKLRIGAILNAADFDGDTQRLYTAEMPNVVYGGLPIMDSSAYPIERHFLRTNESIHSARRRGLNILIHCQAGISRSATLLLAYLLAASGCSLKQGLHILRRARPQVQPNPGFMKVLERYERHIQWAERRFSR